MSEKPAAAADAPKKKGPNWEGLGLLALSECRHCTPLHRLGEPGEMAELALFLASGSATFITGQIYVSDGGWTANGF